MHLNATASHGPVTRSVSKEKLVSSRRVSTTRKFSDF